MGLQGKLCFHKLLVCTLDFCGYGHVSGFINVSSIQQPTLYVYGCLNSAKSASVTVVFMNEYRGLSKHRAGNSEHGGRCDDLASFFPLFPTLVAGYESNMTCTGNIVASKAASCWELEGQNGQQRSEIGSKRREGAKTSRVIVRFPFPLPLELLLSPLYTNSYLVAPLPVSPQTSGLSEAQNSRKKSE